MNDSQQLIPESPASRLTGGTRISVGNQVRYLKDAAENFPAWLEGIQSAHRFICIEMYMWEAGNFGLKVRNLLEKKLHEGVKVYIIYDWIGSLKAHLKNFFAPLLELGAEVKAFNKSGISIGFGIISRDHRKSIIIDGIKAYVGGLCISSSWEGDPARHISPWRDSGLEIKGPAARDVLHTFIDTWRKIADKNFNIEIPSFPDCQEVSGRGRVRVVGTEPRNSNMIRLDLLAISFAERSIWITDAYFMSTSLYSELLMNAAKEGVDVRILVPRNSDIPWIASVSRTQYRSLLKAGVRIFEWNGSMIHCKSLVIDGIWGRVGSTNLNFSSWFSNSELDIVLEGEEEVSPLSMAYLQDIQHCTEIVLDRDKKNRLHALYSREQGGYRSKEKMPPTAYTHQVVFWGKGFNNMLWGKPESKDVVNGPEGRAYTLIALFFWIVTIIMFEFPKVIAYPLSVVTFVCALILSQKAYRALQRVKKDKKLKS